MTDQYAAGEQGLGYIYQTRFALLRLLQLPEDSSVLIEKDDDLDFQDQNGVKTLGSLKHKAVGEVLTDLSVDFWKSVRIWLARYVRDGQSDSNLRFFLFTTNTVSTSSFLQYFLPESIEDRSLSTEPLSLSTLATDALSKSKSQLLMPIYSELSQLNSEEQDDFLSRIVIIDDNPRITDIPSIVINQHMRSIQREFRIAVFERLEGWWNDLTINLLSRTRTEAVSGFEVSDKLSALADEYKSDSLPITFRGKTPNEPVDPETDQRLFVTQLREIGCDATRIQYAILDYYRAYAQRSAWARENVLVTGEIEEYEDRLIEEWERYSCFVFDGLDEHSGETVLVNAGKTIYKWAQLETSHIRIRERVTEPYVVRGGFHLLANNHPPRVYWHPHFLQRIEKIIGASA